MGVTGNLLATVARSRQKAQEAADLLVKIAERWIAEGCYGDFAVRVRSDGGRIVGFEREERQSYK